MKERKQEVERNIIKDQYISMQIIVGWTNFFKKI